jgi:uncharacterized protein (TIGR00251 family)
MAGGSRKRRSAKIPVKVVPRASKDEVVGWSGGRLKLRVNAAPQDGRANAAVEALLAGLLGVPGRDVRIVSGHASRQKTVEVEGLDVSDLERHLPASADLHARR